MDTNNTNAPQSVQDFLVKMRVEGASIQHTAVLSGLSHISQSQLHSTYCVQAFVLHHWVCPANMSDIYVKHISAREGFLWGGGSVSFRPVLLCLSYWRGVAACSSLVTPRSPTVRHLQGPWRPQEPASSPASHSPPSYPGKRD